MTWNPPKFKILGPWFTNDLTRLTEPTVADTFNEIVKSIPHVVRKNKDTTEKSGNTQILHLWLLLPNSPRCIYKGVTDDVFGV